MALQFVDNLVVQTADLLHLFMLGRRKAHELIRMNVLRDVSDVPASEFQVHRCDLWAGNRLTLPLWNVGIVHPCDELGLVL